MDELQNLISNTGFPIVACLGMAYFINTTIDEFRKTMHDNTMMLSKLCDRLDDLNGGKKNDKK